MSAISSNLKARRDQLGLNVPQVHAALALRGIVVAESTVYGWFNGNREVGSMKNLKALCDVLQIGIDAITGDEIRIAEGPLPVSIVRELEGLSDVQKEAVLATIRAMKGA